MGSGASSQLPKTRNQGSSQRQTPEKRKQPAANPPQIRESKPLESKKSSKKDRAAEPVTVRKTAHSLVNVNDAQQLYDEAAGGAPSISLAELMKAIAAAEPSISKTELQSRFAELASDSEGNVTREDFVSGWSTRPSVDKLDGVLGLLQDPELDILKKLASAMLKRMKTRVKAIPDDIQAILGEVAAEDLAGAWDDCKGPVLAGFAKELAKLRAKQEDTVQDFNSKFAHQGFEAVYKDIKEYSSGVEGSLGLPGKDIAAGIELEFCYSGDSKDVFTTSNYNGTSTTPAEEYQFVTRPETGGKVYPGKRVGTPLETFLYAASAMKAGSDSDAYDAPLDSLPSDTRDAVQTVLLRRAAEVGMSRTFLQRAAETDSRLACLASQSTEDLKKSKRAIASALNRAALHPSTGQPRFSAIASQLEAESKLEESELAALVEHMRATLARARLLEEEVLALRLYTGPAYVKLNGTLREREVGRKGNRYVSTIFAAISGMSKLAEVSPIPEGRMVYRGQHGMRLPKRFWQSDAQGVRGGVELAFLSTTTEVEVAVGYAQGGELATVFQIETGAVDKGAALGFLSQYPGEEEILMPPRSFLEVVGAPTLMATAKGTVLCIPSKINCNLQCPRIERLRASRKTMLVSALEHVRKEVSRDVDAVLGSAAAQQRIQLDRLWNDSEFGGGDFIEVVKGEPTKVLEAAVQRPPSWYNEDGNFRLAMVEALEVQRMAMGMLDVYLQDGALNVKQLRGISARDADRRQAGRLRRLMEEAEGRKAKASAVARLCRHLELFQVEVDERLPTSHGETALLRCAAAGREDGVQLLLAAQANVEAVRSDGRTALMLAAEGGLTEIVRELLVEWDAQANAVDAADGRTALMYAAENGHVQTVRTLLRQGKAEPGLRIARGPYRDCTVTLRVAYYGYLRVLQALKEEGALQANAANRAGGGWTPLMNAALNGHVDCVQWLVEEGGAEVDQVRDNGETALMSAAMWKQEAAAKWLVQRGGADVRHRRSDGKTAGEIAADRGFTAIARWLSEREKAEGAR